MALCCLSSMVPRLRQLLVDGWLTYIYPSENLVNELLINNGWWLIMVN